MESVIRNTANAYYFFHPLSFIAMFVYCHCMQAIGLHGSVAQGNALGKKHQRPGKMVAACVCSRHGCRLLRSGE